MSAVVKALDFLLSLQTSDEAAQVRQELLHEAYPTGVPDHFPAVVTGNEPDNPEAQLAEAEAQLAAAQAKVDAAKAATTPTTPTPVVAPAVANPFAGQPSAGNPA